MNEPYRLRYTSQIVGIFLMLLLLFVIVLSLFLLRAGDYIVAKNRYWVEVSQDDVADLHKGAGVMMLGELAGEVERIQYVEGTNRIRVDLRIDANRSDEIFEDSELLLERRYGVGAPVLVLRRGELTTDQPVLLKSDSQIRNFRGETDRVDRMASEVESVSDSIQQIQQKLDAVADRFERTLDGSADPAFDKTSRASDSFFQTNETLRPDVLETSQAIRAATRSLETRIGNLTDKVDLLVEKDMRDTLGEVRESSDDLSIAAKSVNQTSTDVNQDVGKTLADMRVAIEQVRALAEEARDVVKIVRREANELPGTTERFNDTVDDTQDLVGEVRSHWLLRRYSNKPGPTQPVSPSAIRGGSIR
ncbi:MAG: MlaD family protein [Rubripirellula sp.]